MGPLNNDTKTQQHNPHTSFSHNKMRTEPGPSFLGQVSCFSCRSRWRGHGPVCTAKSGGRGGSRLILDAITLCMTAKRGDEREGGRRGWGGFKGWALPFIASWPQPTQRCAVSRRGAPKHRSSCRKKRYCVLIGGSVFKSHQFPFNI